MSTNNGKNKWNTFFDFIKNLFWVLLFLQFAPIVFSGLKSSIEDTLVPKTQVAQLTINGMITDSTLYIKNIQAFLKSPNVKALLVRIDSPGGLPGSAQAIFNELNKFKEKKPVVALIENMGTSAAYNIAAASNFIIASPSSLVGSIGVWLQLPPNVKGLAEDWKIKFRTIQSGKFKTSGSPFKEMTPEETAHLQEVSDDSYNQFVKDISVSRNLSKEKHLEWADGKVFTGNQALTLKLIDKLGSYQDAIDKIKELALIENEIQIVYAKHPTTFQRLFGGQEESDSDGQSNFSSSIASSITEIVEQVSLNLKSPKFI